MDCQHKWIPNGIVTKEIWGNLSDGVNEPPVKIGERVVASCICEICGEIKITTG